MLKLPSVLTQAQATSCVAALLAEFRAQAGDSVEVDASALVQFDSAALAVLLALHREATVLGKKLAVRGLPTRLGQLAGVYGVAELIQGA